MSTLEAAEAAADLPHPKLDRRLVEGRVMPTLLRFSTPLLVTNTMVSLSSTWGAIWVSRTLGTDSLTGLVNASLFVMLLTGLVLGVGSTAGMAVAQAIGARDLERARHVTANALVFALGSSVAIGGLGFLFADEIMSVMRMAPEAADAAAAYFRITCWSLPGLFVLIFMFMLVRGTGDARTPFIFTIFAILVGLAATPAFLVGIPGIGPLGIEGVGWSGIVANTAAAIALGLYAYRRRLPLVLGRRDLHHLRPDGALMLMLVRKGLPVAAETMIVQGAYFVLVGMVNAHGPATAAAYSAAAQLWGYVQMPAIAIATSMSNMAAMNIGAGRWDRIDTIAFQGCLLSSATTVLATLVVYALGDLPLLLFLPEGGEALEIARHLNHLVLWGWIVLAVTLGLNAMVRANGAMLAPTIIFGITMWVLRVPFAVMLDPLLGADAIWWSFPVGSISSALLAYAYYRWGGWRTKSLLGPLSADGGKG